MRSRDTLGGGDGFSSVLLEEKLRLSSAATRGETWGEISIQEPILRLGCDRGRRFFLMRLIGQFCAGMDGGGGGGGGN